MTTVAEPSPDLKLQLDLPRPKDLLDLSRIAFDALCFLPPLYVQSILGEASSWIRPYHEYSEFGVVDPAMPGPTLRYLFKLWVPGWATGPLRFVPSGLNPFWRPTRILRQPAPDGNTLAYPEEAWFYINGVATDETVARMNASLIADMFERPLTVVQNSTNSLFVDLAECAIGKGSAIMTEPAIKAYPLILDALNDDACERAVVICHSQGTIVMSNVLRALVDEEARARLFDASLDIEILRGLPLPGSLRRWEDLGKLEIYAFANCADVMRQLAGSTSLGGRRAVPWIESFGNENDLVARLGMLAPAKRRNDIEIDGLSFVRESAWGHLLNQHYLLPMREHLAEPDHVPNPYVSAGDEIPRLYGYFGGHTPARY